MTAHQLGVACGCLVGLALLLVGDLRHVEDRDLVPEQPDLARIAVALAHIAGALVSGRGGGCRAAVDFELGGSVDADLVPGHRRVSSRFEGLHEVYGRRHDTARPLEGTAGTQAEAIRTASLRLSRATTEDSLSPRTG